ncbi:MAG: ABC transporter substrate-binding protein [Ignavibacteria bacterium]
MTKIKLLITILILPVIMISCGRQKETVQESTNTTFPITQLTPADTQNAVKGDWIIKQIMSDAEKINPIVTNDATASSIITYIFENLLEIDRVTYELKPLIAKSMPEISEDHLTYTFDMKENVTFSDGAPLTGEDIIFTVKVIKNPFTDAQALRNYFNDVKSVELVDGNKYKVKFTMAKPYFRAIYSLGDLEIIPSHLLDLDGMNKKFTWADLEDAQKTFDAKKYPEMSRFC